MTDTPSVEVELDKVQVTIRLLRPGISTPESGAKSDDVPVSKETASRFIATLLLKSAINADESDDPNYEEKFKEQKLFSKTGECVFELRETNKHSWVYVEGREGTPKNACLVGWECSFGGGIQNDIDVKFVFREDDFPGEA